MNQTSDQDLENRYEHKRQQFRQELAESYVKDVLSMNIKVTRVDEKGFKILDREHGHKAWITWNQAHVGELPHWKCCNENKGSAPQPSKRNTPAKKKPGRRAKAKARKQKRKGKK